MKVLDLRCANGHGFEGWFASDDDYASQNDRALLACPLCDDRSITRLPSAPRLNLAGARAPDATSVVAAGPADLQAAWLAAVRQLLARTEDVGTQFATEARRIHYGEKPSRGIRGQATAEERESLHEEGIETMAIPLPRALEGPLQ